MKIERGVVKTEASGSLTDQGGLGTLASVIGATVELGSPANRIQLVTARRDPVTASFERQSALITRSNWVFASNDSDFAVRIISNGQALPLTVTNGQPFVDLKKGDSFQIGLSNGTKYYAGAVTTIDGVNTFAFGDKISAGAKAGEPKYRRWILDPNESHTITGWDQGDGKARQFLITDFANSAAAKMRSTTGIGTITVTYRLLWKRNAPPDEFFAGPAAIAAAPAFPQPQRRLTFREMIERARQPHGGNMRGGAAGAAPPGNAVGIGNEINQPGGVANIAWQEGQPRAVITIRYTKPDGEV